jgi:hypothetical protein
MKEMKVKIEYLAKGESAYLKAKFCHMYNKISMM